MHSIENKATYWETVSETRWGQYVTAIEREAIRLVNNMSREKTCILDLGCEGGRWSSLLASMGWAEIYCTDINLEMLKLCRERLPQRLCLQVGAGESVIPIRAEKMRLVVCLEVFPLIHANGFIDECFRIMKSGAVLLGVIQNRLSYRSFLYRTLGIFDKERKKHTGYLYKFSYNGWRKKMDRKGFKFLYERGFCWLPFSRSSNFCFIPQVVKLEQLLKLNRIPVLSPWIIFIAMKI